MSNKVYKHVVSLKMLPSQVLHEKCEDITIDERALQQHIITNMTRVWEELGKPLGIAANQCGFNKNIILCRLDGKPVIMINPKVCWTFGSKNSNEGCESIGPKRYIVKRHMFGKVKWLDERGDVHFEKFTYKRLRVIEHEIDHLNGKLLTDVGELWKGNGVYNKFMREVNNAQGVVRSTKG